VIDPRSERAQFRQLADLLRAQILMADLRPGDRLPSESTLGQTHGVGRETVRRALRVLRDEGLVVTETGYGTTVRIPEERDRVRVPRGAEVIGRPATADERDELEIPRGGPAWVLVVTIGGRHRVYDASRVILTFA
jgi:DNA-binding transcriptional regulator YhcF (GntR family)